MNRSRLELAIALDLPHGELTLGCDAQDLSTELIQTPRPVERRQAFTLLLDTLPFGPQQLFGTDDHAGAQHGLSLQMCGVVRKCGADLVTARAIEMLGIAQLGLSVRKSFSDRRRCSLNAGKFDL